MQATMISISPMIPADGVEAGIALYRDKLGFALAYRDAEPASFATLTRDAIQFHLYDSADRPLAEATSLRIKVAQIDQLHEACAQHGIVHPNGKLETKPWGSREFAIIDPSGVCITFTQPE